MACVPSQKAFLLCALAIVTLVLLAELILLNSRKQLSFGTCWATRIEDVQPYGEKVVQESVSGSERREQGSKGLPSETIGLNAGESVSGKPLSNDLPSQSTSELDKPGLDKPELDKPGLDKPGLDKAELKLQGCETSQGPNGSKLEGSPESPIPMIFMITPTYSRTSQLPDIVRLCQTLMHVKALHWIVVEDGDKLSEDVKDVLNWCSVNSTYISYKTPPDVKSKRGRGADQRNLGLKWIRDRYKVGQQQGVVYFGDDDNTYHVRLFEEMRYTKLVSIWPVGLAGGLKAESPICKNGKVVDFHSIYRRKFSVDMAGFAVNLDLILEKGTTFTAPVGYLETNFLEALVKVEDLEPKADCKKVYVWHTKTQSPAVKD